MVAADAQYDRFSLLTGFIYLNLGGTAPQLKSVNFLGRPPILISTSVNDCIGMNLNARYGLWRAAIPC
jgi:hypothetical protein